MALTVAGLTAHTQVGGGTWSNYGSGGGSTLTTSNFLSSTSAQGRKFSGIKGMAFQVSASGLNMENTVLVVRFELNGGFAATFAADGGVIRAEDTSGNTSDWTVTGSDTYNGGWQVVVCSTTQTETANSGTACDLTLVQYVGMVVNASGGSGGDPNFKIDEVLSYPDTGLTLSVNTTTLFADLVAWDLASLYGIVEDRSGAVFSKAPLILAPDATGFVSTDEILIFEDPLYDDGTLIDSALNNTGITSTDADPITLTRLFCIAALNPDTTGTTSDKVLDLTTAGDVTADTCTFSGFTGTIVHLGGTGNTYDDCVFQNDGMIEDTGAIVRRGFVRASAAAAADAALLWTSVSNWQDTEFVMGSSNSHAIKAE